MSKILNYSRISQRTEFISVGVHRSVMTDNEFSTRLRKLGFTDKEIATYRALLSEGEATASSIAEEAGVSRRHVYTIAERLNGIGFVEINDFLNPTILRPAPPETAAGQLYSIVEELETDIKDRYGVPSAGDDELDVLQSRATMMDRMRSFIGNADTQIALMAPRSVVEEFTEDLAAAVDRGVLVFVIVFSVEGDAVPFDAEVAHAIRVRPNEDLVHMSVDERYGIIGPTSVLTQPGTSRHAIVFSWPYAHTVLSTFREQWPLAEEVYVRDPDDLPATYQSFYLAVVQAVLHAQEDEPLSATIEARPVGGGRPEELKGEVVEIRQPFVDPGTSEATEIALTIQTEDGRTVTIGGKGAYLEDYEALSTTLERHEE